MMNTTQTAKHGDILIYCGANSPDAWIGDRCRVVELIPHGTYFGRDGRTIDPQPTEFRADLNRYIGNWLGVENLNAAGIEPEYFAAPVSWFRAA